MKLNDEQARALIHRQLDGDALSPQESAALADALDSSAELRAFAEELRSIQGELSRIALPSFPEKGLDKVLDSTTRHTENTVSLETAGALGSEGKLRSEGPGGGAARPSWIPVGWARAAAAVAAAALVAVGAWWYQPPTNPEPTPEEVARQLEMVFKTTSDAIDRSTVRPVESLMNRELSPALRRIPILFSGPRGAAPGQENS